MATRTTHQFQLSDSEFDKLYELAELPKQVGKSVALRTVMEKYSEQLQQLTQLDNELKKLSQKS